MSERIDHVAEAERLLRERNGASGIDGISFMVEANAHAMLALTEQLRAANLLTVQQDLEKNENYGLASVLWNTEIRPALGLED